MISPLKKPDYTAMRVCWNRQTGTFEGRVSKDVWVQVPLLAPLKDFSLRGLFYFPQTYKNKSPCCRGFFLFNCFKIIAVFFSVFLCGRVFIAIYSTIKETLTITIIIIINNITICNSRTKILYFAIRIQNSYFH